MRGVRSFLLLLVVAAGLGAYLYFVESKRDPADADKKAKVFTVEADKIDELVVKSESGDRTTLKKTGTEWQVVEPVATPSDGAAVSGLTSNLSTLELQRVIDENPQDLGEYGLKEPRLEVAFKSGGKEQRLLVGRKTPAATDLYAKLGDSPRVFLIPGFVDTTFNKTTFDLRDKTVLKVDRDSVDTLVITTITAPKRTLQFAKADGEWKLTNPIKARADFTTVDGLISRINTLQTKSIVAPEATALAEYGLDKPAATIQLGSGSSQATLLIGKAGGEGVVYAKDQSRPAVLTIDAALLADVTKETGEYRQTDLFDAPRLQRDTARSDAQRTGGGLREDQDEEQGRPGRAEVEAERTNRA